MIDDPRRQFSRGCFTCNATWDDMPRFSCEHWTGEQLVGTLRCPSRSRGSMNSASCLVKRKRDAGNRRNQDSNVQTQNFKCRRAGRGWGLVEEITDFSWGRKKSVLSGGILRPPSGRKIAGHMESVLAGNLVSPDRVDGCRDEVYFSHGTSYQSMRYQRP